MPMVPSLRPDLDPGLVIKSFIDLCMMWHMSRGRHMCHTVQGESEMALDDRYLEHAVDVILHGIAARPNDSNG